MVAVGDHEQVHLVGAPVLQGQVPAAALARGRLLDAVLEPDALQQAEGLGVGVEVGLDLGVVREVGVVLGHREVLEGQPVLGGVDVQRPVGAGVAVGVAEGPVAADAVRGLVAGVVHPVVAEHLAGGQAADAGPDDRCAHWSSWGARLGPGRATPLDGVTCGTLERVLTRVNE